ncbi:hypothetical protein M8C21_031003 [Ambrosia artemisiifolia]|uniref:Uncharacterized protein n=1 Tax=Ambrosia artemisiifolia TaxID=4212 RepID=A0AAD5D515_AMBAR|nr:hypothetical protein M8C21_031003 [Ambrosia artemisiifolia]
MMSLLSGKPEVGQPVTLRQSMCEVTKLMVFDKQSGGYHVKDINGELMFTACSPKDGAEAGSLQGDGKAIDFVLAKESETQWKAFDDKGDKRVFWASKNNTHVNLTFGKEYGSRDAISVRIEGRSSFEIFSTYKGESSALIAKIYPMMNEEISLVEVTPNEDCALVVSLVMVADAMGIFKPVFGSEEFALPGIDQLINQPEFRPYLARPSVGQPGAIFANLIGPQYTSEVPVYLVFEKSSAGESYVYKAESLELWDFSMVTDKTKMFDIAPCSTTFHGQLLIRDDSGKPIAMLRKKNATAHGRCVVSCFSGESEAELIKVFSVCKSSMIQRQTNLNVIFEKEMGKKSRAADFKVVGSWTDQTCTVYKGDFSKKVAQMQPLGVNKDKFMVEVYPNVDCAFVVSLIAVVDAMKSPRTLKVVADHAADLAVKFAGGAAFAAGKAVFDELS